MISVTSIWNRTSKRPWNCTFAQRSRKSPQAMSSVNSLLSRPS